MKRRVVLVRVTISIPSQDISVTGMNVGMKDMNRGFGPTRIPQANCFSRTSGHVVMYGTNAVDQLPLPTKLMAGGSPLVDPLVRRNFTPHLPIAEVPPDSTGRRGKCPPTPDMPCHRPAHPGVWISGPCAELLGASNDCRMAHDSGEVVVQQSELLAISRLLWDIATQDGTSHQHRVDCYHWAALLDHQVGLPPWPTSDEPTNEVIAFYEEVKQHLDQVLGQLRRGEGE
jgi:hypothetical protein